jgi:Ni,Fe-hydrogenase III large subunit/NADH:ubiquinone oxidoreductase subunit C
MINSELNLNSKNSLKSVKSREILLDQKVLLINLEDLLNIDYIKEDKIKNIPIITVNWTRIRDIGKFMLNRLYRLESICVSEVGTIFEINYFFNLNPYKNSIIIIQAEIEKYIEPSSLKDIFINANYLEKDVQNRMGIVFSNLKPEIVEKTPSSRFFCSPVKLNVPNLSQNDRKYGVFNKIHEEHQYFNFNIHNNIIKSVELSYGWLYKKIQPKLDNSNPITGYEEIFSEIAKNQYIHLNLAYLLNIESILEIKVSNKIKYIRTLLAELERLSSHILWFSNLAELMGKKLWVNKLYKIYLELSAKYDQYFQNPRLFSTLSVGKTADLSIKSARDFYKYLRDRSDEIFNEIYKFVYNTSTETRLSNIGVISREKAIINGLSGPAIRGSGVSLDLRSSEPYLIYTSGELSQVWNIISFNKGDVFARTQVRLWEIHESFEICKNILKGLSTYEIKVSEGEISDKIQLKHNKYLYSAVESPNGKLSNVLRTGIKENSDKFQTVRVINNYNFFGLENNVLNGNELTDYELIIHSFDLNFHLIDL